GVGTSRAHPGSLPIRYAPPGIRTRCRPASPDAGGRSTRLLRPLPQDPVVAVGCVPVRAGARRRRSPCRRRLAMLRANVTMRPATVEDAEALVELWADALRRGPVEQQT